MSQTNHSASKQPVADAPDAMVKLILMVPNRIRWGIKQSAALRQTTVQRLVAEIFENHLAAEKRSAA
jgi:hypothetical protein